MVADDQSSTETEDSNPQNSSEATGQASTDAAAEAAAAASADKTAAVEEDKSEKDRRECHGWGVFESGIDPTVSDSATDEQKKKYNQTLDNCLKARGWSIASVGD